MVLNANYSGVVKTIIQYSVRRRIAIRSFGSYLVIEEGHEYLCEGHPLRYFSGCHEGPEHLTLSAGQFIKERLHLRP